MKEVYFKPRITSLFPSCLTQPSRKPVPTPAAGTRLGFLQEKSARQDRDLLSQFAHSRLPTRRVAHPHTHGGVRNAIISVPPAAKKTHRDRGVVLAESFTLTFHISHITFCIFTIKQLSDSLKPARCRSLASGLLLGIGALFIQHSLRF